MLGAVKEETRMMPQWDLYVVITTKLGGGRPTLELVRGAWPEGLQPSNCGKRNCRPGNWWNWAGPSGN